MKAPKKLTRNEQRRKDYAEQATKHESRSAKRRRLGVERRHVMRDRKHAAASCGNPGCARCYPDLEKNP